jgi:hypothetical protein
MPCTTSAESTFTMLPSRGTLTKSIFPSKRDTDELPWIAYSPAQEVITSHEAKESKIVVFLITSIPYIVFRHKCTIIYLLTKTFYIKLGKNRRLLRRIAFFARISSFFS